MSMHIVGLSYGAYVALFFALKNPKSVKSMVLCEAAILSWLPRLPGGAELYKEFLDGLWKPFRRAVSEGDEEGAVSRVAEFFYGKPPSELPRQMVEDLRCNLTEWKVLTASTDPFPEMNSSLVRDLKIPTLMLSGQESLRLHKLIDQELQRQLQNVKRQIIPKASHDMWRDNPAVCEKAMRSFLVGLEGGGR
jgi:pimeloyl-ACP methyl ester carboxylesterase